MIGELDNHCGDLSLSEVSEHFAAKADPARPTATATATAIAIAAAAAAAAAQSWLSRSTREVERAEHEGYGGKAGNE